MGELNYFDYITTIAKFMHINNDDNFISSMLKEIRINICRFNPTLHNVTHKLISMYGA